VTTPNIREAVNSDATAIAELAAELGYPTGAEQVATTLNAMAASRDHQVFVAETVEGQIIGWIHMVASIRLASGSFAELGGLVVREAYRHQGVGRALAARGEQWARAGSLGKLRVRSRISRADAHRFYASLEYLKIKTQLLFEKSLK
jgi:GNAT superfamily N-acetyltransferase